jgi:putative ABC transport system ATP-binding protein
MRNANDSSADAPVDNVSTGNASTDDALTDVSARMPGASEQLDANGQLSGSPRDWSETEVLPPVQSTARMPVQAAMPVAAQPIGLAASTNDGPQTPVIEIHDLRRTYGEGESVVQALAGVDLRVMPGEFLAIMGASGSGKSTMMNILGLLDEPDGGSYYLDGDDVSHLRGRDLALIRNRKIGFVFQSFNLISTMTALANVELPMAYAGVARRERQERAELALSMVGLAERAKHFPSQLSGGQQQRVAVARSLVNAPALILADEPTGNLDSKATSDVLDVFAEINAQGRTVVLITHEDDVAARASRVVTMKDGRLIADSAVATTAAMTTPYAAVDSPLAATLQSYADPNLAALAGGDGGAIAGSNAGDLAQTEVI